MGDKEDTANLLAEMLEAGEPMLDYTFDPPMRVTPGEAGSILIDCPCLSPRGHQSAGILRIRLTPLAATSLRKALDQLLGDSEADAQYPAANRSLQ